MQARNKVLEKKHKSLSYELLEGLWKKEIPIGSFQDALTNFLLLKIENLIAKNLPDEKALRGSFVVKSCIWT